MKNFITLISFMSAITFATAQANNPQAQQSLLQMGLMSNTTYDPIPMVSGDREFDVKGSPFLSEEFAEGNIFLKRGDSVENKMLRYNIMEDVLEIAMDSYYMRLDANPIYSFHIPFNGMTMDFVNSTYIPSATNLGYLRRAFKGNDLSIFINMDVKRKVKDSLEPYSASKNLVEYATSSSTFFLYKGEFFEVTSKKDLEGSLMKNDFLRKLKERILKIKTIWRSWEENWISKYTVSK